MKPFHKTLLLLGMLCVSLTAFSQDSKDPKTLVDEGVALFDKGDYNGALEKYKAALAVSPDDLRADFELAYTLYALGKRQEAIPYLQPILKSNASKYEAYELLGSIYDDEKQPEKAIDAYKAGIKEKPDFERLHFNLGITYERLNKHAEAEAEAIEALKLDRGHASAHRLYGLATFYQNKKVCAVMGFCNFLLLEPQSKRSVEIYRYIDTIFKTAAVQKNIYMAVDKNSKNIDPMSFAESSIVLAASLDAAFPKELSMNRPVIERLAGELKMVFSTTLEQSGKQSNKTFFWKYYADYFGKLPNSGNMDAFAHYITLSAYKEIDLAWFKEHDKELKDFQQWVVNTKRDF